MGTNELKEYLDIVVDMEKNIFLQSNLLEFLNLKIKNLEKPVREFYDSGGPTKPKDHSSRGQRGIDRILARFFLCFLNEPLISFGIVVLLAFVTYIAMFCFQNIFHVTIIDNILFLVIWISLSIIWFGFQIIRSIQRDDYRIERYQTEMGKYFKKMRQYEMEIEEYQKKHRQELVKWEAKQTFLEKQKEEIESTLFVSERNLQSIYEENVILPQYRSLVMACSLCEYIRAGRCTTLEGHEGAYHVLETEIKQDHMITQMDQALVRLEQLENNQFMLYSALRESIQRSAQIQESINRIETAMDDMYADVSLEAAQLNARIAELQKTSELTAYRTERAQKEPAYVKRMAQ